MKLPKRILDRMFGRGDCSGVDPMLKDGGPGSGPRGGGRGAPPGQGNNFGGTEQNKFVAASKKAASGGAEPRWTKEKAIKRFLAAKAKESKDAGTSDFKSRASK